MRDVILSTLVFTSALMRIRSISPFFPTVKNASGVIETPLPLPLPAARPLADGDR